MLLVDESLVFDGKLRGDQSERRAGLLSLLADHLQSILCMEAHLALARKQALVIQHRDRSFIVLSTSTNMCDAEKMKLEKCVN